MLERYSHDVIIAIEAILANKVRSLLTALGIIFGVAAVISMLAIGNGAQQEILDQIKQVGVNNIIIKPLEKKAALTSEDNEESSQEKSGYSPGLTMADYDAISEVLPTIEKMAPLVKQQITGSRKGQMMSVSLEGVNENYFDLFNITIRTGGNFIDVQEADGMAVCIIGDNIRARLFRDEDPVGQFLKCGSDWLKVIGVIERRDFAAATSDEVGIGSTDNKIYVPINSFFRRIKERYRINFSQMEQMIKSNDSESKSIVNQVDKLIVQVQNTEQLTASAEVIRRILLRRHKNNIDFEVTVPELLLKQQQRTNTIFNIVLGAIAGISLVVGGIGIMNIMLASVWERIREIGTRQAIGATRKDIVVQFLAESTLISVIGGLVGIILGVLMAKLITTFADIKTIISPISVFVAFGVSVSVGIIFGLLPAKRASEQDPVESLRY